MAKSNIHQSKLDAYAEFIKADYVRWWGAKIQEQHVQDMVAEFQISFEPGSSYIKVVKSDSGSQRLVHSFICNKDGKYPKGTILKAASWKAPATNFPRAHIDNPENWEGNILWTGTAYGR